MNATVTCRKSNPSTPMNEDAEDALREREYAEAFRYARQYGVERDFRAYDPRLIVTPAAPCVCCTSRSALHACPKCGEVAYCGGRCRDRHLRAHAPFCSILLKSKSDGFDGMPLKEARRVMGPHYDEAGMEQQLALVQEMPPEGEEDEDGADETEFYGDEAENYPDDGGEDAAYPPREDGENYDDDDDDVYDDGEGEEPLEEPEAAPEVDREAEARREAPKPGRDAGDFVMSMHELDLDPEAVSRRAPAGGGGARRPGRGTLPGRPRSGPRRFPGISRAGSTRPFSRRGPAPRADGWRGRAPMPRRPAFRRWPRAPISPRYGYGYGYGRGRGRGRIPRLLMRHMPRYNAPLWRMLLELGAWYFSPDGTLVYWGPEYGWRPYEWLPWPKRVL